METRMGFFMD